MQHGFRPSSQPLNWPSREEWAKSVRTPYLDRMPKISDRIADYATPEEMGGWLWADYIAPMFGRHPDF